MRHIKPIEVLAIVGAILVLVPSRAGAEDPWVGRRVILKTGIELSLAGGGEDEGESSELPADRDEKPRLHVFRVKRVREPWLWLVTERGSERGWVQAESVVAFEQAFDYLTAAIQADPKSAPAYIRRGLLWQELLEPDKAIKDYDEAIRLAPKDAQAYAHRGNAWRDKQKYDKAIADYDQVVNLDPRDASAYYHRGNIWRERKEYEKAILDFGHAIRLDPESARAFSARGSAWSAKKDYDRALADYNEALRLEKKTRAAARLPGAVSTDDESDRAIAKLSAQVLRYPNDPVAYENRGYLYQRKKAYDKALADYNEAVRLDPGNAWAYNSRAWIWATCPEAAFRDGKRAFVSASKACELSQWKDANALDTLAAAYAELGDFEHAILWQRRANGLLTDKEVRASRDSRLALYRSKKAYRD